MSPEEVLKEHLQGGGGLAAHHQHGALTYVAPSKQIQIHKHHLGVIRETPAQAAHPASQRRGSYRDSSSTTQSLHPKINQFINHK